MLFFIKRSTEKGADRTAEGRPQARILQIGNYPPPVCGWAMQTKGLVEEIRRRGNMCQVLNLNENRKRRSSEYIDVQNGFDYLRKLTCFALNCFFVLQDKFRATTTPSNTRLNSTALRQSA